MENQDAFIVQLTVDAWLVQVKRVDKLVAELGDEQLQKEIAPGKNTGAYIIGHLAAVHDALFPLLNFGKKLYPELEELFIKKPDKSGLQQPPVNVLTQYMREINTSLESQFLKMNVHDWLQKHTAVTDEDFQKQPQRNKLNVLLSRTNHLAYHFGQLILLKK